MNGSETTITRTMGQLRTPKPIKKMSIDLSQMYSQDEPTSSCSLEDKSLGSPVLRLRTRRSVHCFESEEAMENLTRELSLSETRSCNPVPMDLRFKFMDSEDFKIDELALEDLF